MQMDDSFPRPAGLVQADSAVVKVSWVALPLLALVLVLAACRGGPAARPSFPGTSSLPVNEGLPDPLTLLDGRKVRGARVDLDAGEQHRQREVLDVRGLAHDVLA